MQNIAIALPVGEESDLVSGHLDHDSIARFLVNESALQQTTTKIRPFSHLSYYGETKTRGDQEGTIKATHVLSLVLSRSSYDSIISERPVFCLSTLSRRERGSRQKNRIEHLSCVCIDCCYYTGTLP